jgi:hypothetical protein
VKRFVSHFYDPEAFALDAFSNTWDLLALVCPPVKLLPKVVHRMKSSCCQGVLIVPNWPASNFYASIFTENQQCLAPFRFIKEFRPYIYQHVNATNTPLFGNVPFTFFALYFDTK